MEDDDAVARTVAKNELKEENLSLRRQIASLENRLNYDFLTQTLSKAGFYKCFEDHAQQEDVLYFVDIDNFKSVNDSYGHDIGDLLLVEIAQALVQCVSSKGHVGRLADDEFLILMPKHETVSGAAFANKICKAVLTATVVVGDLPVSRSASVGMAQVVERKNPEHTVIKANTALRLAKERGKNCAQYFKKTTKDCAKVIPSIDEVRRGIKMQEIGYFLQPIVNLKTDRTVGYEALIRWNRRNGEVLGPAHFLNNMTLAYSNETKPPLTAAHHVAEWATIYQNKFISFNISSEFIRQFIDKGPDWVTELIGDIPHNRVIFELVETMVIEEATDTIEVIRKLREMGIRIALDDFGIGHSTLHRLQSFQVDYVKIDRHFLEAAGHTERDKEIMRSIIELINASGAEAIVEGIEDTQQLNFAKSLGASYGQGFFLGQPAPMSAWNTLNPDFPVQTLPRLN